jgi:hypothetical protein
LAPLLKDANPAVPAALSAIVERMLAKDLLQRFGDTETLGREIRANFTPRGTRVAPGPKRRRMPVGAAAEVEGRSAGAADAPALTDDLTAAPEAAAPEGGPATAEIPKVPMSRARKIALAAVAAAVVMGGLVALLVVDRVRKERYRGEAEKLLGVAQETYRRAARSRIGAEKKDLFAAALEQFREIDRLYRSKAGAVAGQARVTGFLARAQVECLQGDDEATDKSLRFALETNRDLQRKHDSLYDWTQKMDTELAEFRAYWLQRREYATVLKDIQQARSEADLDAALALVKDRGWKTAQLVEEEKQLRQLEQEIRETQKQTEYLGHVQRGDELAKKPDVSGATAEYNQALAVLESAKGTLKPAAYESLKKAAETKRLRLQVRTNFQARLADAKKVSASKLLQAKAYLAAADVIKSAEKELPPGDNKSFYDALKPDVKELASLANGLQHDHFLDEGLKSLQADRVTDAEGQLKTAQSFRDSPEVRKALEKLQGEKDFRRIVADGRRLFGEKNYEGALEKFQAAVKIKPADQELKGRMDECNYHIAFAKAEGFRAQKEWAKALSEYQRAKRAKPDRSAEIDARIALVKQQEGYDTHLAAAEAARAKGNWAEAMARLTAAKAILATPEVDQLIARVRYEEHVQRGDQAMEERDYVSAGAYYKLAKGFLATPEIDVKIQQAEDAKKKSTSP